MHPQIYQVEENKVIYGTEIGFPLFSRLISSSNEGAWPGRSPSKPSHTYLGRFSPNKDNIEQGRPRG